MTLWTSKISTVAKLYHSLDSDFLTHINDIIHTNGLGSSLFRLLLVKEPSDALGDLLKLLLSKYNPNRYCFEINGHSLNVTLEDVLFLTWLPIQGDPVIPLKSRDLEAFETLFGIHAKKVPIDYLISIAKDKARANDVRETAVLLIIVNCMICPNQNGQTCNTTFAQILSRQGNSVDSYAWGAAMLSCLYFGITKSAQNSKKSIDGNIWLILSFFLFRIPKLQDFLHIESKLGEVSLLISTVEAVLPISKNRKPKYKNNIQCTLENLSDEDIVWRPYDAEKMRMSLPASLHSQVKFGTLVAPLFCIDKVVHHRPNVVPKQFEVFDEFMVDSLDHVFHEIKQKHNRGPRDIDFMGFYAKEIEM